MFKTWGKKLDEALGNPSHLNSSIDGKRKAKENEYKAVVHTLTGGGAYPGQAEKEDVEAIEEAEYRAAVLASLEKHLLFWSQKWNRKVQN